MKLTAFAATTSSQSINRQLVDYALTLVPDDTEIQVLDLNDFEMPIYSVDREVATGVPQLAHDFYNAIGSADALLISFAEHNGFYTAAYKNTFDWMSRIDGRVYQDKPTVMLATSPGSTGAANVLATAVNSAQFFGNDVKANMSVPNFGDNFDAAEGRLTNPDLDTQLRASMSALIASDDSAAA